MGKKHGILAGVVSALVIGVSVVALAAGYFTNGVPVAGGSQYPSTIPLTGNETVPADTNLGQGINPASEAITVNQLGGFSVTLPSKGNALIGGDSTTNLWQRGTAGVSTTSATVAWDSADRWGQWTLSSGGVKLAQDTTAADLPVGYKSAIALTHTTTTGGQICMGQAVESVNSYQFDGSTAELDFHAATGAGYTGGATLTAYITYGTGTDEGLNKMAFTVNAGGATGWTSGVNATAAVIPLSAVSTIGRFAAIANIPATATEIGVAFCYTAGTTDTNDYVAFSGVQLVRSNTLTSYASATVGYASTTIPLTSFERRPQGIETALQYRYYWQIAEPAASLPVSTAAGAYYTTTTCEVPFQFPVAMRIAPTVAFGGNALSATTFAIIANSATPIVLATTYLVQSSLAATNTVLEGRLKATTAAQTAGQACELVGAAGGANIQWNAEL